MRDLNIDFMDLYKRTDRFIKDAYSSSEGVSEYIRLMEASFVRGSVNIRGWKSDYDYLKHIRWIRNQLAHEVSYDCDICLPSDYEWLENFYARLFSATDSLGELRKFEEFVASNKPKPPTANRTQQSPGMEYPPLQSMPQKTSGISPSLTSSPKRYPYQQTVQQQPSSSQSSGCLFGVVMMIVFVLAIILVFILY